MNPVPHILSFSPTTIDANSAAFTLTITGTGFASTSVAYWNGSPLATVVVNSNQLTATVPQASVPTGGTYSVQVFTPETAPEEYDGGTSNALVFTAAMSVAQAIELMEDKIDNYRLSLCNNYFTYSGSPYDCNDISKANIIGTCVLALANGGQLPPGTVWRDKNNVNHSMTGPQMIGLGVAMFSYLSGQYAAAWQHKANVDALTTTEAVLAYDFSDTLWLSPDIQY